MAGRAAAEAGKEIPLVYSRFEHPNAEILEDQIVPLERGATCALAFNSGMAAIMTSMLAYLRPGHSVVYTVPIYGGTQHFIQDYLSIWGIHGVPVFAGHSEELDDAIRSAPDLCLVLIETHRTWRLARPGVERASGRAQEPIAGRALRGEMS
jgi:cystathionine beta-lyase/cystathionine gamma-synthase